MRWLAHISLGLLLAAALGACSGGGGGSSPEDGDQLEVATLSDAIALDGALVSDQPSLRIVAQIFEGLTGLAPGTTRVIPKLALRWEAGDGGRAWTFELRRGVRFHDGTRLDARAVCTNFDRWYGFGGSLQSADATYYWHEVFGGFRQNRSPRTGPSLYRECRVLGPSTVQLVLTRPFGALPAALALPSFGIASPEALRRYRANEGFVDGTGNFIARGSYASKHPTGTGPFEFSSWTPGHSIVLARNDDYWGPKARVERVAFRPIAGDDDRIAALDNGDVDIVDLYGKADVDAAKGPGVRVVGRPPFDVGYVGMNQEHEPFARRVVREAIALGLDRGAVADAYYAPGAAVAQEFTPPSLAGYAATPNLRYDPRRAQALLRRAGLSLPVPVELRYPTGVVRPYLPDPEAIAERFATSLERAGFSVALRPEPWLPDYLRRVRTGGAALYLLGWIGDYADAGAFLEPLFGPDATGFGLRSPALERLLARAEAEPSPPARASLYRRANRTIMRVLPGVPFVTTRQPVGLRRSVRGFVPSPLGIESLAGVSING